MNEYRSLTFSTNGSVDAINPLSCHHILNRLHEAEIDKLLFHRVLESENGSPRISFFRVHGHMRDVTSKAATPLRILLYAG